MTETELFEKVLSPDRMESFLKACNAIREILYETNKTLNLTRIPESEFMSKHVADSLALAGAMDLTKIRTICDVGCGAGFPSLILAAAFPEIEITAIDSTRKKVDYVARAAEFAGLKNLRTLHGRANELARKTPFYESFDLVTARAVSNTPDLIPETFGFLKPNGSLCVYRTPGQTAEEIPVLKKKNIRFRQSEQFELPGNAGTRLFLFIPKVGKK